MPQNHRTIRYTLGRALLSTSLLLPACMPPQATYLAPASHSSGTSPASSHQTDSTQTSSPPGSTPFTGQPTAAPSPPYGQSQTVLYPSSNPGTVFSPPNSPSTSSDGVKVQVFFPTEGNVAFGIQANLGNSIIIELQDQQGTTESQSISRQDYPQLLTFSRIKPGSLNVNIFNEQRELLNTGYQQATVPDFNTAIQITATPSQPLATVQTGSLTSLNINTSFTETSRLDETTPAELVEELDFSSAEWRARIAADYATETIQVGQRVPETGFHSKQVLYQLNKAPFRTYKVFFPSTGWTLGAHWDPQKAMNSETFGQPGKDCSWTGFIGIGSCQTLTFESRNRSPFFLRPSGWGVYALKVEDVTDQVGPPAKNITINPLSPLNETIQKGERFYYRFFAKRNELYTVHLATESGDADLYGGTTLFVKNQKGITPHTTQADNSTPQRFTDADGKEVRLKSNHTCGSSEPNACYDSFQWREPEGRDYTVMVYGFQNSKFRLRVEQGSTLQNTEGITNRLLGGKTYRLQKDEHDRFFIDTVGATNYYVLLTPKSGATNANISLRADTSNRTSHDDFQTQGFNIPLTNNKGLLHQSKTDGRLYLSLKSNITADYDVRILALDVSAEEDTDELLDDNYQEPNIVWDSSVGVYNFVIGDDISTLLSPDASALDKIIATVSLAPVGKIFKGAKVVHKGIDAVTGVEKVAIKALKPHQIGRLGEEFLERTYGGTKKVFKTSGGKRVVDAFINGVARESKVGYVRSSSFIRQQILKDKELLLDKTSGVNKVQWHVFESPTTGNYGVSKEIRELLQQPPAIELIEHGAKLTP